MTTQEKWDTAKVGDWLDAKFYDDATNEIFFVEEKKEDGEDIEDFIQKCQEVADENFANAEFRGLYSSDEADILGYDTY